MSTVNLSLLQKGQYGSAGIKHLRPVLKRFHSLYKRLPSVDVVNDFQFAEGGSIGGIGVFHHLVKNHQCFGFAYL